MVIHDSLMLTTSIMVFIGSIWFFIRTLLNLKTHGHDIITHRHFFEHAVAVAFVSVGALFMIVSDSVHLFSQIQSAVIEYPESIPEMLLRAGIFLFLIHMIKEQTPNHPFYIREYKEFEK